MSAPNELALIVSHTHWDREWYKTAEAFRIGLVHLIDDLLDRDDAAPFLLDGQAIVLEDYLAWRPERRADLARALADGRLAAGPWYVLGDNLIPGGEALIRNLLAGRSVLRFLRATPPPVLYCPDSFGHPAAVPLLAAGFGLDLAIVWRGYGGRLWPDGDTARWRHASGAEVLLYHLPPAGYEFGSALPPDEAGAAHRWQELHRVLAGRSRTGVLLILNGADHHAVQENAGDARRSLGQAAAPVPVSAASLMGFAAALAERSAGLPLPIVAGELRASPDYVWSLQGTFGARAAQKRDNAALERLIVREVEPWAALHAWHGAASHSFALRALWRLVLSSHPHDTLCGCSVDEVALAMTDRMRRADRGARELQRLVVGALAGEGKGEGTVLVLANPAPRVRGGLVEAVVDVAVMPVPVGPGSHVVAAQLRQAPAVGIFSPPFPAQLLDRRRTFTRDESPRRYPRNVLVERQRMLLWVPDIPPFALRALTINEGMQKGNRLPQRVRAVKGRLSNSLLSVWVDRESGLCLEASGRTMHGVLNLESEGECGDLYTHSALPETRQTGRLVRSRVMMRGPLRAELLLTWRVPVAAREARTAAGEEIRHKTRELTVHTRVQLDAGRPLLRIILEGNNDAHDMRLRAVFRTGIASLEHVADAAFGQVRRSSRAVPRLPDDVEHIPPTAPLHRYVTLSDHTTGRGATVFSDGLAEYEATEQGDVAVTLLRSVGELSRGDLPERRGHAGWPEATPGAQCEGAFTASFALMPHGTLTEETLVGIEEAADDFLVPPTAWTLPGGGTADRVVMGPVLEGRGLRFESCKESEDGGSLVVRCTNLFDRPVQGSWALPGVQDAYLCRLDETPLGALPADNGRVAFTAPPFAVTTIIFHGSKGP